MLDSSEGICAAQSGFEYPATSVPFSNRNTDPITARVTATSMEHSADRLRLAGGAWPWRPTTLFALTVPTAMGVTLVPAAATRRNGP